MFIESVFPYQSFISSHQSLSLDVSRWDLSSNIMHYTHTLFPFHSSLSHIQTQSSSPSMTTSLRQDSFTNASIITIPLASSQSTSSTSSNGIVEEYFLLVPSCRDKTHATKSHVSQLLSSVNQPITQEVVKDRTYTMCTRSLNNIFKP